MSLYPAGPADSTGVYPALTGLQPMSTGRRVAVFLVDGLLQFVVALIATLPSFLGNSGGWLPMVLYLALLIAELWAMFAKSSRLAGVFMGAQYVDVSTGLPSGGKLFLKMLLQGLISGISLGIAPVIMVLATVQPPLMRNWFDRASGLMLVDRRGHAPAPAFAQPAATGALPYVAPVEYPGYPAQDEHAGQPVASVTAYPDYRVPPTWGSTASPYPDASPAGMPPGYADIRSVSDPGGLITGVPDRPAAAPSQRPDAMAPAPDIIEPVAVPVEEQPASPRPPEVTLPAADLGLASGTEGPQARLDDGSSVPLDPPAVIGRNPLAPASAPDARPFPVDDPLASKTHLMLGRSESGAWVVDLHSRNGVFVQRPGDPGPHKIEPQDKVALTSGTQVHFGRHTIRID